MQKFSQPISICGPIPKFRCENEEIFLLVRFFHDFQKFSKPKNIFLSKKLIFSQPRSPAPNGKPSHPRGGLAGKLQHCPVANISCSKFLQCVLRAFYYVHLIFSHCMLNSEKTANFWLLFWKSCIMWEVAVQRVYTMCTGEQPPF